MNTPLLQKERNYFLIGDIDDQSYRHFAQWLHEVWKKDEVAPVTVVMNSDGGYPTAGIGIAEMLVHMYPMRVTTIASGVVASTAVIPYVCADHRVITRNSWIVVHGIKTSALIDKRAEARDLEMCAARMEVLRKRYVSMLLDFTKERLTEAQITNWMKEERHLSAADAVKYGLADEVIE